MSRTTSPIRGPPPQQTPKQRGSTIKVLPSLMGAHIISELWWIISTFIARRENRYLADRIFLLAKPMFASLVYDGTDS